MIRLARTMATRVPALVAACALLAACAAPDGRTARAGNGVHDGIEAAPRIASPDQIVGLSDGEVTGLFGTPSLLRREDAAQVWQYAANDCVLLVFLYEEGQGAPRVRHAEARAGTPAACLSRLQNRSTTTASRALPDA
jgi:hypothetical protein